MKPHSSLLLPALLVLSLSACPAEQTETTHTDTTTQTTTSSAAPAGDGKVYNLGEPAKAEELAVIVHNARTSETIDELGDPARKATAGSGEAYLIVMVEVGNTGQSPASFSLLSAQPKVVDAQGKAVDMDFLSAAALARPFPEGAIPPGGSLRGEVPFKVKTGASGLKLSIAPSLQSGPLQFALN